MKNIESDASFRIHIRRDQVTDHITQRKLEPDHEFHDRQDAYEKRVWAVLEKELDKHGCHVTDTYYYTFYSLTIEVLNSDNFNKVYNRAMRVVEEFDFKKVK
jgi:hypothetical protein